MAEANRARAMRLKAMAIRARSTAEGEASTQPQQAAPVDEDPMAGVEAALGNTLKYATNVAKIIQEEILLGYGDELSSLIPATFKYIMAGADGKKSWGQTYDQELRKEQRIAKEFRKENPTAANLAAGTGMAAPAVLTMGVGMGPTAVRVGAKTAGKATTEALGRPGFMRRVAGGTAAGGTYGAVYGAGKAEGGIEERLSGADETGAVGAAVGAATPIVGAIARAAISHVSKRIAAKKAGIDPRAVDPIQEALESGAEGVAKGVKDPIPDSLWADLYPETRGLLSTALVGLGRFGNKGRKEIGRRADESGAKVGQSLDDTLGIPEGLETAVARMTAESKPVLDRLYGAGRGNSHSIHRGERPEAPEPN